MDFGKKREKTTALETVAVKQIWLQFTQLPVDVFE